MFRFFSALAAMAIPTVGGCAGVVTPPDAGTPTVVAAYYPGYAAARYPVERIPADRLTHLFYAFAHIEDGRCIVAPDAEAHFAALADLKRRHPALRTLISIGGWDSDGFSDAALTGESRERLVASCLALFFERRPGTFDGVDLDWEFPVSGGPPEIRARPEDRRNMTLLAAQFRRGLDALGAGRAGKLLLTAALPAGRLQVGGEYDPATSFEIGPLSKLLDLVNLMTYDMGTASLSLTGFNAPLREDPGSPLPEPLRRANTVESAVDYYLAQGVPAHKLVLGVAFHARGARVADGAGNGLYRAVAEPHEPGDWRRLSSTVLGAPGWERHWSASAQSPWLYQPAERLFVTYEDPRSIAVRAAYARERGLRGVFAWELTGDDDAHRMLHAMAAPFAR